MLLFHARRYLSHGTRVPGARQARRDHWSHDKKHKNKTTNAMATIHMPMVEDDTAGWKPARPLLEKAGHSMPAAGESETGMRLARALAGTEAAANRRESAVAPKAAHGSVSATADSPGLQNTKDDKQPIRDGYP